MSAGAVAAAAAAAAQRRLAEEEEEMTPYKSDDLSGGWEFKILRSMSNAFGNSAKLQEILAEEAKAGWVFLEKFDNGRIRLKRPASAKGQDATLGFDAYRTYAGMSEGRFTLTVIALTLGGATLVLLLVLAIIIAVMAK
jgi:hypothetical protein